MMAQIQRQQNWFEIHEDKGIPWLKTKPKISEYQKAGSMRNALRRGQILALLVIADF
jgi:hypothetical protein